jgi:acyl transferase domain-containing protein
MAIAGGVNVITSPNLHQNLAAASFLNPNGSSRAFDASAAGYCRGEGAGIIVLKPLSKALHAGDNILAVIAGSAVNQSSNLSSITVPDSQSQSTLYRRALSSARIDPKTVQYVEAHGTGTQVGDPIEYESVSLALTGGRKEKLFLGSVKDNIGHAEAASGAAGIIKVILMIQRKIIPKQANFVTLNPRIKASDTIQVPEITQEWATSQPVALLNNYGASGNNAAIVLRGFEHTPCAILELTTYPIVVSAKSPASLMAYLNELKRFALKDDVSLRDLASTLMLRQNPSFEYRAAFIAETTADLVSTLERTIMNSDTAVTRRITQPVVLLFGGQTGRTVKISKELYVASSILRRHLVSLFHAPKSDFLSGKPLTFTDMVLE